MNEEAPGMSANGRASEDVAARVRAAQIAQVYKQGNTGLLGSLLVACGAAAILWADVPHWKLIPWVCSLAVIQGARFALFIAYSAKARVGSEASRWGSLHALGSGVSGLAWGITPLILWPGHSPLHQAALAICIVALSAAAVLTYSPLKESFIAFLLPAVIPGATRFVLEDTMAHTVLGLLGFAFVVLTYKAGRDMNAANGQALVTGIENRELAARTEILNEQLLKEISERMVALEALKDSETRLGEIIDFLPDATFVVDHEGRVVTWNKAIEELTGIRAEDMLGKGNYEYAIPFYGARRPILIDLVNRRDEEIEQRYISVREGRDGLLLAESYHSNLGSGGVYLWAVARSLSDSQGNVIGAIESIRDMTDRRREEEELLQAKEKAEAATRIKSEFLANMSHEIRTPMNAIMGMTDLALGGDLSPKVRDYLTKIDASSRSLLGIINDILDFSKIEAEQLDLASVRFDLRDVFGTLSDLVSASDACRDIEFLVSIGPDVPCRLVGDPLRLKQVLTNLASNAVKFTPEGQVHVKVELEQETEAGVNLKFSVTDTGIGIAEEKLGSLFDPFTQADSSAKRQFGGTGLGLTICKRLIDLMGGEIGVESEPGKGSVFWFRVEFALQPVGEEGPPIPTPADMQGMRVLVVDDDEVSQEILVEILESFSFQVFTADSGEVALEHLIAGKARKPFDLIVVDWKTHGIDGMEMVRNLKREDRLAGRFPKIIMVTAFGAEEARKQSEDVGIDAFLSKPVRRSILLDTIMDVFAKQSQGTSLVGPGKALEVIGAEHIGGARILVAEDNELNQQVAKEILENSGASVRIVWNGKEAVDALNESEFDAVLMDIQMPEMDGFEAARVIRSDDRYKDLPIIAMTAHAMKGDREKSLKAGMNDHITKPIDPRAFLGTLAKWIGSPAHSLKAPIAQGETADTAVDHPLPRGLPGIEVESALERVGGKVKVLKSLLANFAQNHASSAAELRHYLESKDNERARQSAHTIKGVAGNISAILLHEAASQLENAIRQDNPEYIDQCLDRFENALSEVLQAIATLELEATQETLAVAERGRESETPPLDLEAAIPVLRELAVLLEERRFRATKLIDTIQLELVGSSVQDKWSETRRYARSFRFSDALCALEEMARELGFELSGGANGRTDTETDDSRRR